MSVMCLVFTWIMRKVQSFKIVKITKHPRLYFLKFWAMGEAEAGEARQGEVSLAKGGHKEAAEVKRAEAGQR